MCSVCAGWCDRCTQAVKDYVLTKMCKQPPSDYRLRISMMHAMSWRTLLLSTMTMPDDVGSGAAGCSLANTAGRSSQHTIASYILHAAESTRAEYWDRNERGASTHHCNSTSTAHLLPAQSRPCPCVLPGLCCAQPALCHRLHPPSDPCC